MSERAKIRNRAGLTQVQLSNLTGVPQAHICQWERGDRKLRSEQVARIRAVLQAQLAEFLKSIIAGGQHAISQ